MSSLVSNTKESKQAAGATPRWLGQERLSGLFGEASQMGSLVLGSLFLVAACWGCAVAVAELDALFVGVSLLMCIFIFFEFRIGIILLIILMPISASYFFPHGIAGIVGLNPLNLLLIGTLGSCLLHGSSTGGFVRLAPSSLLWLYVLPMIVAALLG